VVFAEAVQVSGERHVRPGAPPHFQATQVTGTRTDDLVRVFVGALAR
jgi:hypothetical protein